VLRTRLLRTWVLRTRVLRTRVLGGWLRGTRLRHAGPGCAGTRRRWRWAGYRRALRRGRGRPRGTVPAALRTAWRHSGWHGATAVRTLTCGWFACVRHRRSSSRPSGHLRGRAWHGWRGVPLGGGGRRRSAGGRRRDVAECPAGLAAILLRDGRCPLRGPGGALRLHGRLAGLLDLLTLLGLGSLLARERLREPADDGRLDRRRRRAHELAHLLKLGHHGLAFHTELFREFVNPDLRHCSPLPGPSAGPGRACSGVRRQPVLVIAACSSGAHRNLDLLSRLVSTRLSVIHPVRPTDAARSAT
jgi:hypothetical protein